MRREMIRYAVPSRAYILCVGCVGDDCGSGGVRSENSPLCLDEGSGGELGCCAKTSAEGTPKSASVSGCPTRPGGSPFQPLMHRIFMHPSERQAANQSPVRHIASLLSLLLCNAIDKSQLRINIVGTAPETLSAQPGERAPEIAVSSVVSGSKDIPIALTLLLCSRGATSGLHASAWSRGSR